MDDSTIVAGRLASMRIARFSHNDVPQYAFVQTDESDGKDYLECLNPDSLSVLTGCKVERMLAGAEAPAAFQFLRLGYFAVDNKDSAPGHLVFNRAVALKDSFKKA